MQPLPSPPGLASRLTRIKFLALLPALLAAPASATEQTSDAITFAGQRHWIIERPLGGFLQRLPKRPQFDYDSTANYKGYTAQWAIMDSRLYLTFFVATTNDQPFLITHLFPNRNLPFCADWYSGTLHIVTCQPAAANAFHGRNLIAALHVTNGVVVATNDLSNVGTDSITFAGQKQVILEAPLRDVLQRLPQPLTFDVSGTRFFTAYSAGWRIRDSRLYLTSFEATTNQYAFPITCLFPGRDLPLCADWYSGRLHITDLRTMIGRLLGWRPHTCDQVTVLEVTNGLVVATNVLRNVSQEELER